MTTSGRHSTTGDVYSALNSARHSTLKGFHVMKDRIICMAAHNTVTLRYARSKP